MQFPRLDPRRLLITEAIAAALALSACGGGGSTDAAEQSGNTAVESTTPVEAGQTADSNADAGQTAAASADAGEPADANAEQSGEVFADASTQSADPVVSGDTPAPEPEAGESGFGSMEAESKNFEQLELAQGGTYEEDTGTEDPATDAASEASESADAGDRESAQSLTNIAGRTGYAKPKVAALDYSSSVSSERRALLAKFKFVILGGRGGSDLNSFTTGIRSKNPSTRFAYYVAFNELACSIESGNYYYSAVQMANKADYWLRYASGSRAQWTSQYNTCDMNISGWAKKNSAGQTWMQYKARYDVDRIFSKAPKIEYAFTDNTFSVPRVNADWKRIRTNQLKTDSAIITAQRQGHAAYWSALRSIKSGIKIIGNANNDLSYYEYKGKTNGAMQEAAMGKSWSLETWAGWDKMMARYRRQIANSAAPKDVFLEVRGSLTDYKLMRYGLASALLENGWFVHLPSSGTFQPKWFDEYEAPIGTPVESPPTTPKSNGIWMRKYQNGLVLVNPSKSTTKSIYIGSGYKRLKGTQDPYVNTGASQSTVTLGPRQGLIMIKQ